MNPFVQLPLVSFAAVSILMMLIWVWAYRIKNAGIVDIFWAFNFLIIAIVIYLMADGNPARKMLLCILAGLWSLRLGIYLLIRVGSHLDEEEGRYKQLREEWNDTKFFFFYQMQAFSNVMLSIPFFIIALNPDPEISMLEYFGAV